MKCVGKLQGNGGQHDCGWGFNMLPRNHKENIKNLDPGQGR